MGEGKGDGLPLVLWYLVLLHCKWTKNMKLKNHFITFFWKGQATSASGDVPSKKSNDLGGAVLDEPQEISPSVSVASMSNLHSECGNVAIVETKDSDDMLDATFEKGSK